MRFFSFICLFNATLINSDIGPVAGGGTGVLEPPPPQKFLEVKKNMPKNIKFKQFNVRQSVLNSDAASAFSQPLIICLLPVRFLR